MRKVILVLALAALIVPAAALATKPPHPTTPASTNPTPPAPKVSYILHGTFTAYAAAAGTTNGSVTITLTAANHQGKLLVKGTSLTFAVSSKTKIVGTVTIGHHGVVKVRGPKSLTGTGVAAIVAQQVIDQGK